MNTSTKIIYKNKECIVEIENDEALCLTAELCKTMKYELSELKGIRLDGKWPIMRICFVYEDKEIEWETLPSKAFFQSKEGFYHLGQALWNELTLRGIYVTINATRPSFKDAEKNGWVKPYKDGNMRGNTIVKFQLPFGMDRIVVKELCGCLEIINGGGIGYWASNSHLGYMFLDFNDIHKVKWQALPPYKKGFIHFLYKNGKQYKSFCFKKDFEIVLNALRNTLVPLGITVEEKK